MPFTCYRRTSALKIAIGPSPATFWARGPPSSWRPRKRRPEKLLKEEVENVETELSDENCCKGAGLEHLLQCLSILLPSVSTAAAAEAAASALVAFPGAAIPGAGLHISTRKTTKVHVYISIYVVHEKF